MFDIGFWELTLITVVALLVIGPERLPTTARTVGLWVGRMRGFVLSVKADIDKELRTEELQRAVKKQARDSGLHQILDDTKESLTELKDLDRLGDTTPSPTDNRTETEAEHPTDPPPPTASDKLDNG